jgi:hypothetical protein
VHGREVGVCIILPKHPAKPPRTNNVLIVCESDERGVVQFTISAKMLLHGAQLCVCTTKGRERQRERESISRTLSGDDDGSGIMNPEGHFWSACEQRAASAPNRHFSLARSKNPTQTNASRKLIFRASALEWMKTRCGMIFTWSPHEYMHSTSS